MLASDDVVFAWAIGKALVVVIASFGILVYVAWAVTYQQKSDTHVGIPKESALKYNSSVRAEGSDSLQTEQLNAGRPEQPSAAA